MNTTIPQDILDAFSLTACLGSVVPFGNGHINDTYLVEQLLPEGTIHFILQHMNKKIFKQPVELMENLTGVTSWIRSKAIEAGGDPDRETLNVKPAADGKSYYVDTEGEYWRVLEFVEDSVCYEQVSSPDDFYRSALAFGNFQRLLSDYPAHTLHETIPDFHNTPQRFQNFLKVLAEDPCRRAASVQEEIEFVRSREAYMHTLTDREKSGVLPLRVTHNDTKLNNILFDRETGKALCVIDLDTVMPGLSVNDFGDSIRFGASTAAEDEQDLSKVSCDLELFEVYSKGFIEGCQGALTDAEIHSLIDGAIMMTLECGMRFFTDHLDGDHYFKIHREGQNLDRARTQFTLVADMEQKRPQMVAIIEKIVAEL